MMRSVQVDTATPHQQLGSRRRFSREHRKARVEPRQFPQYSSSASVRTYKYLTTLAVTASILAPLTTSTCVETVQARHGRTR